MKSVRSIIVVGAGPAGMLAAGRAAELGSKVTLLERGPRTGRKLRICGKGRANVTNICEVRQFLEAFGDNGKFLYGAFHRFFNQEIMDLLERLGVPTKIERGGRVFPDSDDADDVADALEKWCRKGGVEVIFDTRVKKILVDDGCVAGVSDDKRQVYPADAVILATGGITYPLTGSTGDGYKMARELGHKIIEPRHAVTAMVTEETWPRKLSGLSLKNVEVRLWFTDESGKRRQIGKKMGEMLMTHWGVSGPIVLTLSRKALDYIDKGRVDITIDMKPALSDEQLLARFEREFTVNKHFKNWIPEILPRKMAAMFPEWCGISADLPVRMINLKQKKQIIQTLRNIPLHIVKFRPPEEAIVTAGGVDIREVDPRTMESKVVDGLYLAGEVIDIDATTGGYNLQGAFSTGWIAGESAARKLLGK